MAKILIVDDSRTVALVLQRFLQRDGHEVLLAPDGALGLDLIRHRTPDLVVLDRVLPGLDGIEVCRQVRSSVAVSQTPIIMVTGTVDDGVRAAAQAAGVDELVAKEAGLPAVMAAIQKHLGALRAE